MFALRKKCFVANIKPFINFQRFSHTYMKGEHLDELYAHMDPGINKVSRWKKHDSRGLGLNLSKIPPAPSIILWNLKKAGFEAYLVGGCVRDLLLNRIPKDFDVITTAALDQVKKQFRRLGRAIIVGRRFPICQVHIRGCMVEVSSFDTVAAHQRNIDDFPIPKLPKGCDKKDVDLWKNCMNRDFTVNSLFYDPYTNKIYDYVNALSDIMASKLETLKPAQQSFEEDCARILRGLRLAARLGLSFSKDTESAIHKLSQSILTLAKARVMMEVNYMLAYGAAQPSLCLLHRFHLLQILLPVQAAYLTKQSQEKSNRKPIMLMKLFSNLDLLVSCDRPADSSLWVTMLAFHSALVRDPPEALVVLTFGSVLYYGNWKEGVEFARSRAQEIFCYVPEMSNNERSFSDKELAEEVMKLASHVQSSAFTLTETEALLEEFKNFPEYPEFPEFTESGNVFVPKRFAGVVAQVVEDLIYSDRSRVNFEINYRSLYQGNVHELRFVLGKIIMHTILDHQKGIHKVAENQHSVDVKKDHLPMNKKRSADYKEELAVGKKQKLGAAKNTEMSNKVSESINHMLKEYSRKASKRDEIQQLTETLKLQQAKPKPKPVDNGKNISEKHLKAIEKVSNKVSKKQSKSEMDEQKNTDDTVSEQPEPSDGKQKRKFPKLSSLFR